MQQRQINKVYVAGASTDMDRVQRAIGLLGLAGLGVTCTWPTVVAATPGGANPTDATTDARRGWSETDLREVSESDLLWFLTPASGATTRGAWLEAGYAHASGKLLVFSGENTKQSVFCALGDEFADDVSALAHICRLAREGSWK